MTDKWISVGDKLPKEGIDVLVFYQYYWGRGDIYKEIGVGLGSTICKRQQQDEDGQQMFHLVCMVVCNLLLIQFLLVYCPPRVDDVSQYEGDDETDIEHGAQGELTAA